MEKWAGGLENYSLDEKNGVTTVSIACDITDEEGYKDYFDATWPKALNKLKEISES